MSTYNICFRGKIRKPSIFVLVQKWLIWSYDYENIFFLEVTFFLITGTIR